MTPRKKQHSTEADKQKAWTERQQQAGRRRVCVWLSNTTADALKARAMAAGQTQGELLEALLLEKRGSR
ncbi:MAG: hypothetical protein R6X15_05285 [Pseudomonadota bacterium]